MRVFRSQVKEPPLQLHQTEPDDCHVALRKSGEARRIMRESSRKGPTREVLLARRAKTAAAALASVHLCTNPVGLRSGKEKGLFKIQRSTSRALDLSDDTVELSEAD